MVRVSTKRLLPGFVVLHCESAVARALEAAAAAGGGDAMAEGRRDQKSTPRANCEN